MNNRSVVSSRRPSRITGQKIRPVAPSPSASLAPDSLAWAIKTAASCVAEVIAARRSLTAVLGDLRGRALPPDAVLAQAIDLAYATLRRYRRGDVELSLLLDRPTAEDALRSLLRVALCWLEMHPERAYVGVDQAVVAAGTMSGGRYRGFVNAILRRALRERMQLDRAIVQDPEADWQYPAWWLARLQADWPEQWEAIAAGGNRKPSMALRVNRHRIDRADYIRQLEASGIPIQPLHPEDGPDALLLVQPQAAESLPGFTGGLVSVQDLGAQQAARLLDVQAGMKVLDACAAPGGKAAHLLEWAAIDLLAVEIDQERCATLTRALSTERFPTDRHVRVVCADAGDASADWAHESFDAILLDAPCSGSGVAGRHPDAKWLRREDDVYALARTQKGLLKALWPLLKPGGRLLYGTCSVFALENQIQIQRFLEKTPDAGLEIQRYYLPNERHDGFFYALLSKS